MKEEFLRQNEQKANLFVAQVMRITIPFLIIVYILNEMGVFIVEPILMRTCIIAGVIALIIPTLLINVLKLNKPWVKYVIVTLATLVVGISAICLSYHVVIIYVYSILLASTYYDRKLDIYTLCVTVGVLAVCQILGYLLQGTVDDNVRSLKELIIFFVIPREFGLVLISSVIIVFNKRTRELISMCIQSNQNQAILFEQLKEIMKKSVEVSKGLAGSVEVLSDVSKESSKQGRAVSDSANRVNQGINETTRFLEQATHSVMTMASNLEEIAAESENVGQLSQQVSSMSQDNGEMMNHASNVMTNIHKQTEDSKNQMHQLGIKSQEIRKIAEAISSIASQTNLLALNATIEAARAGEGGKGFAVVASEIGKLADESQKLSQGINDIIEDVVKETTLAVASMDENAQIVEQGLEIIGNAKHFVEETRRASQNMDATIQELSAAISLTAKEGESVSQTVDRVNMINEKNKGESEQIADRAIEQQELTQKVADSVKVIEKMSKELLEISKNTK